MQKDTGFTLLELMVVIAMVAILTAIAIPNTISWRNNAKLNGDVLNFRGDLEMAKLRAIKENDDVAVLFNANGYEIFIDNGDDGGVEDNWVRDGGEVLLTNKQLSGGVTMATDFPNSRTEFTPRGRCAGGTAVITNSAGTTKSIVVSIIGRIRVQ